MKKPFFAVRMVKYWLPREIAVSILGDAQNLTEHVPQQINLADPALSRGVEIHHFQASL